MSAAILRELAKHYRAAAGASREMLERETHERDAMLADSFADALDRTGEAEALATSKLFFDNNPDLRG